jgi:hypothetical protein
VPEYVKARAEYEKQLHLLRKEYSAEHNQRIADERAAARANSVRTQKERAVRHALRAERSAERMARHQVCAKTLCHLFTDIVI